MNIYVFRPWPISGDGEPQRQLPLDYLLLLPWKLFQRLFYCFLLPDWLKLDHLKSRMECGFSDIFSCHICSTVADTIGVTNSQASFGAKRCSENHI